ncbi:hypothetical protein GLOTRDRAFT_33627 [Gloeophyllum trabeum ATCC 11539]|uniref:Cyclin N-terminal domain-containing protein n=1 Tax=Gloeophyllum trabeum (strain ATCC 11539 / FP-39264 / Madison 617) TaxID=670483 RepID=S7QJ32_GLOTA|nr:uncharacterized protein GLOTRDRAFT_33627 [Gloeophyllum trabeum ATCC 11539]EPQ59382.1 hypothetical protein GLOTRDRAFT_33627 [Gloeophyllum trabeum ATCC 11539]
MPVPVYRSPAHRVIKHHQSGDRNQPPRSVLGHLKTSLPLVPLGPPPSFGSREEWINSLPSWRRNKSRETWEETSATRSFDKGLTVAANATVIKGVRAEACIPPVSPGLQPKSEVMDAEGRTMHGDSASRNGRDTNGGWHRYGEVLRVRELKQENAYEKGAFTPVFEDMSPEADGGEADSSPPEPVTPFGEYVDRAMATGPPVQVYESMPAPPNYYPQEYHYTYSMVQYQPQQDVNKDAQAVHQVAPSVSDSATAPVASAAYRKLAEPLSEWVASYVWKACVTGMGLPAEYTEHGANPLLEYSNSPPSYLAGSVRGLFLSTLLQPSAVFLAVWYILRLPAFLGPINFGPDRVREAQFRTELLNDSLQGIDKESVAKAPYKLIVLGCMLANKWLDDHTFSNKTWHTISSVPILSLNRLESLALHFFGHDLSIDADVWSNWLQRLLDYHVSLPGATPQPISRPSSSPHAIIKKTLEDLMVVPSTTNAHHDCGERTCSGTTLGPVFLGLEDRRLEKAQREEGIIDPGVDVLEIDLDEDGPLREEYLPRRRISRSGSVRSTASSSRSALHSGGQTHDRDVNLPPPAKWSPAADEPIVSQRNRENGQYIAVRPPLVPAPVNYVVPPPPYIAPASTVYPNWAGYAVSKPSVPPTYMHENAGYANVSGDCGGSCLHPSTRSRSHSVSYDHANSQCALHHARSRSQARVDYGYSEVHMSAGQYRMPGPFEYHWAAPSYSYPAPYAHSFAPGPRVDYQQTWLRA